MSSSSSSSTFCGVPASVYKCYFLINLCLLPTFLNRLILDVMVLYLVTFWSRLFYFLDNDDVTNKVTMGVSIYLEVNRYLTYATVLTLVLRWGEGLLSHLISVLI